MQLKEAKGKLCPIGNLVNPIEGVKCDADKCMWWINEGRERSLAEGERIGQCAITYLSLLLSLGKMIPK